MRKFWKVVMVTVALLLVAVTTASAVSVNRSPDATLPHSPELNQADYWGDQCTKVEWDGEADAGFFSFPHTLIVIKSGQWNFVWYNTVSGWYGTPTFQGVSHFIYCDGEVPTPTPTPTPTVTPTPDVCHIELGPRECEKAGGEYVGDEVGYCDCGDPTPTPTPKPCFEVYELIGKRYNCYLLRNRNLDDNPNVLPVRYDGTDYMYDLCSTVYTCGGVKTLEFEWTGKWNSLCKTPCMECE